MMASDRDTLIELIDDTRADGHSPREAADYLLDAGWRPPAHEITTAEELAELDATFPCVIREKPADPTNFYPAMWEMGFQVGWCRAGQMFDPDDCTPTLPVTVVYVPTEEDRRGE